MRPRLILILTLATFGTAGYVTASGGDRRGDDRHRVPGLEPNVFGHSVRGEALIARRLGDAGSSRKVLVVGIVHGDEPAGFQVIRALQREHQGIRGVDLWTVAAINPDGWDSGTRRNARGVDLNRNFSYRWSGDAPSSSRYYAGPRPFSEPESRALRDLIVRIRPDITIYYHQPWGQVLAPCRGDARLERLYSRRSGIPLERCRGERLTGTMTSWQEHRFPDSSAFVVELLRGRPRLAAARRNAHAVAAVAHATDPAQRPAIGGAVGSSDSAPSPSRAR